MFRYNLSRFWGCDMIYNYNKENFNNKLDKIVEARYKTKKANTQNKQYRAFYSDFRKKNFSDDFDISASVRAWRSYSKNQLPKIEILIKLCSLLDCDIDYFITEQTDFRKDLAAAAETTGLDYTTIDELTNLPISEKHIVDAIFGRTIVSTNLIKTIKEMLYYSHPITKNQTYIKLDKGLTARDKDYEELEHELNKNEVIDILSYKLSFEMRKIIESLSNDEKLSNEINQDYKNKFFQKHKKILSVDELPKLMTDDKGNLIIDTDEEIYRIEKKILDRLEKRDKKGRIFDYGIDYLHNYLDFSKIIKQYRIEKTKQDYLSWLKFIDDETE